jgi:OmpR family two-component system sensor histidine kinase YxdK
MKNYLKIHLPMILFLLVSIAFIFLLTWLDGYRNFYIIGYGFLLVSLMAALFFSVDYYLNRGFYHYLKTGVAKRSAGFLARRVKKNLDTEHQKNQDQLAAIDAHHQNHIKFMNIWVHQMKTPVSVLELMAESGQVTTDDLLAETDRLKSGLATALNFVRLEDFGEDFIIESTSLLAILKQSIGEQKRNFIRHKVYPKITNDTDFLITTDKKWLQILLFQLISNGIKYSYAEHSIVFTLDETKRTLTIADTGRGIADADLPRVFRPFFTGSNGREIGEATGMGLYLVSLISQKLAIDVSISSVVNQGTVITLTFTEN